MPSPGVGLRHYAPNARLILIEAGDADLLAALYAEAGLHTWERVGIMLPANLPGRAQVDEQAHVEIFPWGDWGNAEELAHRLFAGLRALDAAGCAVIVCPMPPEQGIGAAIRDRLRKAAAQA
jgi:L-threonylcarbamoyladenylate synthase